MHSAVIGVVCSLGSLSATIPLDSAGKVSSQGMKGEKERKKAMIAEVSCIQNSR